MFRETSTMILITFLVVRQTSSRPEVFCKKSALKIFTKFTGKILSQSLFFSKIAILWNL